MADNIDITPGSGKTVATDDCGAAGHTQVVKLAYSANGDATPVAADVNGMRVSQGADTYPAGTLMQNAATATGVGTTLNVQGYTSALLRVQQTGTSFIAFEVSMDDTNWVPIEAAYNNLTLGGQSYTLFAATADGTYRINVAGWKSLRANLYSYTSGTVTVRGYVGRNAPELVTARISGTSQVAKVADVWPPSVALQSAATATGNGTTLDVRGYAQALLVTSGSWNAVITVEASVDDTNWVALDMTQLVQGAPAIVGNIINNGQTTLYRVLLNSYKSLRARISGYTSGSVTINGYLSNTPSDFVNVAVVGSVGVTPTAGTTDVVASGNITTQNLNPTSGTATTGSTVAFATNTIQGRSTVGIQVTGVYTGNLTAQGTTTGSTWVDLALIKSQGDVLSVIPSAITGLFSCDIAGLIAFRITALGAVTGTAAVTLRGGMGFSPASIGVVGRITDPITLMNGTGYPVGNEDVASTNNDAGMKMLATRKAVPSNTSDTDGDYEFLQLNNGRLWVSGDNTGLVSTNNSSATPLGSGAVFTGTADDITDYAAVTIYVFSNIASATDGLSIQQSSDGTNWDHLDLYTVPASTGKSFHVQAAAKFFRVVYTNSGSAQGSFRLQTILHKNAPRGSSQRPQDARPNDNDMEETLAYQMVFNGTTWDRLRGSVANGMTVDVTRMTGVGLARKTNPTPYTDGARVDASHDSLGRQVVVSGQVRDLIATQNTLISSSSAETTILTAVAATFLDLVQLVITNQTATAVNVTIKDSTAGTTRMVIALAASGGAVIPFTRPVPQTTVNNNWTATLSSAAVAVNIFAMAERNV